MPIIQATTPTNAGWAQSFDTSGVAQIAAQERDRKNKRLQELLTEYDTRGIWDRDTEYIQGKIEEVNDFAMKNSKELANPSKNMKTWQEFQKMQSDVKNSVVYSIGAKEKFDKANQSYNNSKFGMYMTDQNRDLLFSYAEKPTSEQYLNKSAFDDPMKYFDANLDIRHQDYVDIAGNFMSPSAPSATGATEGGRNVVETGYELDKAGLKDALTVKYNADTLEGASLRKQWGSVDEFTEDVAAMTNKPSDYDLVSPRAAASASKKTAADIKRENAVVTRTGSGHTSIETKYTTDTNKVFTYTDDNNKKQDAVQTWGVGTVGGNDNVMMFYPDLRVNKNITVAQDMTTGKMLKPGEGKRYKYQIPLERATYMVANKRIEYVYTDENGKKVKNVFDAGETVPDFDKMLADNAITKTQHRDLSSKVHSMDGYMVYATTEQVDYFDLAEGEDVMNMLEGKGGRILNVPAYTISPEVDQQLLYKHGTTQKDYAPEQAARPKYGVMDLD